MLKYVETAVVMAEVPDEISLAINLSNCPHRCPECHSKHLQFNNGKFLDEAELRHIVNINKGVSCVVFMGGDSDHKSIFRLAKVLRSEFPQLKLAWYSGNQSLPDNWYSVFDYIKIGPYLKDLGPLNSRSTNQRMYKLIDRSSDKPVIEDITYKFWK